MFIQRGSTINLTCLVRFAPEPPPAVLWSHNSKVKYIFLIFFIFQSSRKQKFSVRNVFIILRNNFLNGNIHL
ncbi:hypothetical protein O3M35_008222 [Rhynocoris fuscipes]|uniref:Ig-like domain-containing protein n=1 Tax=Rhynocoris fuscipes TaxID=488301 RepID=A0AAW1DAT9_9HEMI